MTWKFGKGGFVHAGRAGPALKGVFERIGTAIVGGDFTGNRRGAYAIDFQSTRANASEVASGANAVIVGNHATASGVQAVALGVAASAGADYAVCAGGSSAASGAGSLAVGYNAFATALEATAFGARAVARVQQTANITGPIIVRADKVAMPFGTWFQIFAGAEIYILSGSVNLMSAYDYTLTLPAGCRLWLNEVGVICVGNVGVTGWPTIRFGVQGNLAKHMAATVFNGLTQVGKRQFAGALVPADGETTITAGVTIAATGTTLRGRYYWRGLLVEDE